MLKFYLLCLIATIIILTVGLIAVVQHKEVNQHIDASAINMAYYYCDDHEGLNHIISEGDKGIAVTCNNGVSMTIEKVPK